MIDENVDGAVQAVTMPGEPPRAAGTNQADLPTASSLRAEPAAASGSRATEEDRPVIRTVCASRKKVGYHMFVTCVTRFALGGW